MKLSDDVIQSGSELVRNFTDDHGQSERSDGFTERAKAILSRIRMEFRRDSVVLTKNSGDFRIKILDVLIGPMNLRCDSI